MRLLKLNDDGRFSLQRFPKDKIPRYAILPHTWGTGEDDEVTFKDLIDGTGDNKTGFQKLQFCGNQGKVDDHCPSGLVATIAGRECLLVQTSMGFGRKFRWRR
jgi:hypothetical protein